MNKENKPSKEIVSELRNRRYKVRFYYERFAARLITRMHHRDASWNNPHCQILEGSVDVTGPFSIKELDDLKNNDSKVEIFDNGGATHVTITDSEGQVVSKAAAYCSINDVFNKELGRRIALGRALKAANL